MYANPVDPSCNTFIQCSWSEPYVRDCNPGLLFNSETKLCDFPYNVDCKVRLPKDEDESSKKLILNQVKNKNTRYFLRLIRISSFYESSFTK